MSESKWIDEAREFLKRRNKIEYGTSNVNYSRADAAEMAAFARLKAAEVVAKREAEIADELSVWNNPSDPRFMTFSINDVIEKLRSPRPDQDSRQTSGLDADFEPYDPEIFDECGGVRLDLIRHNPHRRAGDTCVCGNKIDPNGKCSSYRLREEAKQ